MANYNQSTSAGSVTQWQRSMRVEFQNPYNGTPYVTFFEEQATQLPDGTVVTQPLQSVSMAVTDLTVQCPLLDPTTGNSVGTMTFAQIYQELYSVYLYLAQNRDAAASAAQTVAVAPVNGGQP